MEMNSVGYLQRREEKEEEHEWGRACTGLESRPVRYWLCVNVIQVQCVYAIHVWNSENKYIFKMRL